MAYHFVPILFLLITLSTLATGAPTIQSRSQKVFKLMVDPTSAAPSSIAGKYLTVNTDNVKYAYLGIDNDGSHLEGYVKNQTDPTFGEIQVMGELGAQTALDFQFLWLRPVSDDSEYFVRLGDPMTDAVPEISLWKEWSITSRYPDGSVASLNFSNSTALVYTLDYSTFEQDAARKWSACGQKSGGWVLYYNGAPKEGCTEGFMVRVMYEEKLAPIA